VPPQAEPLVRPSYRYDESMQEAIRAFAISFYRSVYSTRQDSN